MTLAWSSTDKSSAVADSTFALIDFVSRLHTPGVGARRYGRARMQAAELDWTKPALFARCEEKADGCSERGEIHVANRYRRRCLIGATNHAYTLVGLIPKRSLNNGQPSCMRC